MRLSRVVPATLALTAAATLTAGLPTARAAGQPETPPSPVAIDSNASVPTIQTIVRLVVLDVVVVDADGNPARGYGAATATPLQRAVAFGTLTLDQIPFTIATTPSSQIETLKPGELPPAGNFLTPPFRTDACRNIRIHYQIDPRALQFSRAPDGSYLDDLQFVAIAYRDDGVQANALSSSTRVASSASSFENNLTKSAVSFDQTLAVPIAGNPLPGNFYLRVAVMEKSTGRIGVIEIPTEWIKPSPISQTPKSRGSPSFRAAL